MFDYMRLTKLTSTMCDNQRIKYASSLRLPTNVELYLRDNEVKPEGCISFFNDKAEEIRIFIVYGKANYAMYHDIIDNKYTFCIMADYLLSDENEYMKIFNMISDIFDYVLAYTFHPLRRTKTRYIKDTFFDSINEQVKNIAVYNLWVIFGDRFLDDYQAENPRESISDIKKIMQIFRNIE